ncbi:MAG: hypothetical protein QM676_14275 [Novosphingobium sp.]
MSDKYLPLGNATASDIRDLKQPGLLLPMRADDPTLLVTKWDEEMYGVMLTGVHAFVHFPITIRSSQIGLFLPQAEILIDFSSRSSSVSLEGVPGTLVLQQNRLSAISNPVGEQFADPDLVPLWQNVAGGSDAAKVAFTRWGIGIRNGEGFHALWERQQQAKSTVAFFEGA